MYWIEVSFVDSGVKTFKKEKLNDIYTLFGKYSQKRKYKRNTATEIKFGKDDNQTGVWTSEKGVKPLING
jgi:hypothetical protein